jgi:hypothetical protein
MTGTQPRGDALWFVTEQACCLTQNCGQGKEWFKACEAVAEYLTDGDAEALARFREQIGGVTPDPDNDRDYDPEDYEGKDADIRAAVTKLATLGSNLTERPETRTALLKTAELLADFYGAGDALDAVLGEA